MLTGSVMDRGVAQDGYSLIELLMALVAGIVVISALFTIVITTLHQTTRTFSKLDATQRARVQFSAIENELHSACLADQIAPIQIGSGASTLVFVSQYGDGANLTATEHQITYSAVAGTLTDASYAATGGSSPTWTFASTPTITRTLLTNVSQTGTTPVFQYFAYRTPLNGSGQPYTDAAGDPYVMLLDGTSSVPATTVIPAAQPLTASPTLSASDAQSAAEVLMTLTVGPAGGTGENTNLTAARVSVTDGVVFRLTPPANHAGNGASFIPCQ
jgi:hypothetical protein